jgi:hypothetical protein
MNRTTTATTASDKLVYGRRRFGTKNAFWVMICGILTTTLTALMLWYTVFSNSTSATILRQHDGIAALLKLLLFSIALVVLSRLMRNSDTKDLPKLTLTSEGLIFQDSNGKCVQDRWENFGPFRFVYTTSNRQRSYIIQSLRTDDEHQAYRAFLYMNVVYLDVDSKFLLQEMNYRRKVALGIDLGRNLQTHVSSVERNMLMLKMLDYE